MKFSVSIFTFFLLTFFGQATDLMPIDPLWKSDEFRKALTGSYGIDARIEPKVTTEEKAVLDAVAADLAKGERDAAAEKIAKSSLLKTSPALFFNLGNLRFEQGKIEDAVENFEAAIKLYPNFRDAHRNLAIAFVQQSAYEKAEPHLTRAIELGAQDGLTMGLLGYVHGNADRHQAALQAFRLAQLTMPRETQWKAGEAHALQMLDQPKAAISIYAELIALNPAEPSWWMNQADAFLQLDEPEKAIANLELTRRLDQLGPEETISLGHLFLNASLADRGLDCYLEAIEKQAPLAKTIDALSYLAQFRRWENVRVLSEKIDSAYSEALADSEAERVRRDRILALLELEDGDPERGAKLVESILQQNPMDGEALLLLAQFRLKTGSHEEAVMLLEQAERVPETEVEALRIHGQILVNRQEYQAGLELLERALGLEPDNGLADYIESIRALSD